MSPDSIPKPAKKYLAQEFSSLATIIEHSTKLLKNICNVITDPQKNYEFAKKIYSLEDQADVIRDRLLQSFALEHQPPAILLDQVALMHSLNRITNKIEHAAKQIEFTGEFFPSVNVPELLELTDIVLSSTNHISKAVNIIFDSFKQAAEEIEHVEDLRNDSRTKLFEIQTTVLKQPDTNFQKMFVVEKTTLLVQQVAERAKQTADLIKNMALKYL